MNWLDWVFILIIIFSTIRGLSTGFIVGVSSFAGLVLGITSAIIGYRSLAVYLDNQWGWGNSISELILNYLPPTSLQDLINKISIVNFQLNNQNKLMSESLNNVADQLAINILYFISFFLILIFVSLFVKVALGFFSGAVTHTFLRPLDYLGGLILGLVRGLIIVLVVAFFLEPISAASVIASQEKTGFIYLATNRSLIIPYALELLNMFNLHLP
ncbi:Colicin V production protein [Sporotomaculum syntrophicum]|uniref:Colicin V production protein n=1 Tax=Sporotomaculum syntrophicum TaxID=182264 RepID=A0A9D3AZH9_9FIRM|nr:CvpA family protein [Sporotomaculum syntrophicum]KAF1085919.1 Colicin V production protein [Sporotomaculum syntrophicum]